MLQLRKKRHNRRLLAAHDSEIASPGKTFVIDALRIQAYLMLAGEISVRYNVLFA